MIRLGVLDESHVAEHNAGEDAEAIRWLSEIASSEGSTRRHFAMLAENASQGCGKRGFSVWLDDRLAGYIDFDPDAEHMPHPGDVNLAYSVHPWARGQGVATAAVNEVCDLIRDHRIGTRAIIRTEPGNLASAAVAKRCGFDQANLVAERRSDDEAGYITWTRRLDT